MEWNRSISQIQRILKTVEKIEDEIDFASKLKPAFEGNADDHRKMIYFLILNSKTGFADQLANEHSISLLLNTIPSFEIEWLVKAICIWNGERFLLEIARYSPYGIAMKIIFKILSQLEVRKFWTFYSTLAGVILRRISQVAETSPIQSYLMTCLNVIVKQLAETLRASLTASDHESGDKLLAFLHLTSFAIQYEKEPPMDQELQEFYALKEVYEFEEDTFLDRMDIDLKLRNIFLVELEATLMLVNVNAWLLWADRTVPDGEENLQTLIGQVIFNICEKIQNLKVSIGNEVWLCLNQLKIKPLTPEEKISKSTLTEKLEIVKAGEDQNIHLWYEAIIECKEAWQDPSIVSIILSKANYTAHTDIVVERFTRVIGDNPNDLPHYFKALKDLSLPLQVKIFERLCHSHEECLIHPCAATEDQDENGIVEQFNKLSSGQSADDFFQVIFTKALQNPIAVVRKIFEFAISVEDASVSLKVLSLMKPILSVKTFTEPGTNHSGCTLLEYISTMFFLKKTLSDKQFSSLIDFYQRLIEENLLPTSFMKSFVIPALEEIVVKKDWTLFHRILTLFQRILNVLPLEAGSLSPLLIFMALLLSETSWDVESFDVNKAEANDAIARSIIELLQKHFSDADLSFISKAISFFPDIIKTHFASLWVTNQIDTNRMFGESPHYVALLARARSHPCHLNSGFVCRFANETDLLIALIQVLPIIHPWEWEIVEDVCKELTGAERSEDDRTSAAFKIISKAMSALAISTSSNFSQVFERCMNNFSYLFSSHLSALPESCHLRLLSCFLTPLSRVQDEAVRYKLYLLNIPTLNLAYSHCQNSNDLVEIELKLNKIDKKWRDIITKVHL